MAAATAPGLNERETEFGYRYLASFNGSEAAKEAGYSPKSAASTASRLLKKPEMREFLARERGRTFRRLEITRERILEEYAKIAFGSLTKFMRLNQDGEPIVDLAMADEADLDAISQFEVEDFKDGRGEDARDVRKVKLKLHDKKGALDALAKIMKLFEDPEDKRPVDALAEWMLTISQQGSAAPIARAPAPATGTPVAARTAPADGEVLVADDDDDPEPWET